MISVYPQRIPLFSVIVCTYNRAHLLPRALESLCKQTETDWEAIIVDDGSTDETQSIIKEYCAHYPAIRSIYHSNRGLSASRNAGVLAACGMFITFLDSDDEYHAQHLEVRKQVVTQNPNVPFFHGGAQIIGNQYVPDKNNPKKKIHLDTCVIGGTFVVRRDVVLALGGFPHIPFGDDAAFFELAEQSHIPIAKVEDAPTYIYYRDTPDSICNTLQV